jgi:hypothetical protein
MCLEVVPKVEEVPDMIEVVPKVPQVVEETPEVLEAVEGRLCLLEVLLLCISRVKMVGRAPLNPNGSS